jgi:acetone carboxylase gamma subunit
VYVYNAGSEVVMKCLCGYEGDDFTWLPLLEVCIPDSMVTEEEIEKQEKELDTPLPKGELKRAFACPKCGTVKIEVKKE